MSLVPACDDFTRSSLDEEHHLLCVRVPGTTPRVSVLQPRGAALHDVENKQVFGGTSGSQIRLTSSQNRETTTSVVLHRN